MKDVENIIDHALILERSGLNLPGQHSKLRDLYLSGKYSEFYKELINTDFHSNASSKPKFVVKQRRYIYNKYKLLRYIKNLPSGKRKYIILHKYAYDRYKELKTIPAIKRTEIQANQILELKTLMHKLKIKINN